MPFLKHFLQLAMVSLCLVAASNAAPTEDLRDLKLHYLHGRVLYERVLERDRAQVVLEARLKTVMGEHTHWKLYELRRDANGRWLIDDVQEYGENYLGLPI